MDAVEFLKGRCRMCAAQDDCKTCRIDAECREYFEKRNFSANVVEKMVSGVEQWAKDHPAKTRQSEFLKMFPDARLDDGGVIHICPNTIDTTIECIINDDINCNDCRRIYWLQKVE